MGRLIRGDLKEIGWKDVDWMDLTEVRDPLRAFMITVMKFWVP
jgi:hypothetical protein